MAQVTPGGARGGGLWGMTGTDGLALKDSFGAWLPSKTEGVGVSWWPLHSQHPSQILYI